MKRIVWLVCLLAALAACNQYQEGAQLLQSGKYEKAAIYYKDQLKQDPDNAFLHNQLGYAYARLSMFRDAELEYRKAIQLDDDYFEAYLNLGTALIKQRRHRGAQEELKKALELRPQDLTANVNLAFAYLYADDLQDARQQFIKIREMTKGDFQYGQTLKQLEAEIERRRQEQAAPVNATPATPEAQDGGTAAPAPLPEPGPGTTSGK